MGLDMYLYQVPSKFIREDGTIPDIMIELYDYCVFTKESRRHLNKADLKLLNTIIKVVEREYPTIKDVPIDEETTPIPAIIKELAYWRKAHAIDEWFARNVGERVRDRGTYHCVTKEQLEELVSVCKKVEEDPESAPSLLPLPEGIEERESSFGPRSYGSWYFYWVNYTIERVTAILKLIDFSKYSVVYYSSE